MRFSTAMMVGFSTAIAMNAAVGWAKEDVPQSACVSECGASPSALSAEAVPEPPASPGRPADPANGSIQSGAGLQACLAWTDGCVTCERADGKIACSNIGIACQPGAAQCLKHDPAQEKQDGR